MRMQVGRGMVPCQHCSSSETASQDDVYRGSPSMANSCGDLLRWRVAVTYLAQTIVQLRNELMKPRSHLTRKPSRIALCTYDYALTTYKSQQRVQHTASHPTMSTYQEYSVDTAVAEFFTQTSSTRKECDDKAIELVGGKVVPVTVQGSCSYTVYAGPNLEFVAQFRLRSLMLDPKVSTLVRHIYGSLAPNVSLHGQLGLGEDGKEPLFVYTMSRIRGVTHLDSVLKNDMPRDEQRYRVWRKNLLEGVARYVSLVS